MFMPIFGAMLRPSEVGLCGIYGGIYLASPAPIGFWRKTITPIVFWKIYGCR